MIYKEVLEKISELEGFSSTFPFLTLGEILSDFADKMIVHDFRGFGDRAPDEGWVVWAYISNKYLWVIVAEYDSCGELEYVAVKKYKCNIINLAFSSNDQLVLPLLKVYEWDRRQDP